MLALEHDRITFAGTTIANIKPGLPLATLRHFEDAFREGYDEQAPGDLEQEHEKAVAESYAEGFDAGREEGEEEAKNALADERAAIEEKAFADGYAKAMQDAEHAADAARVQNLLLALAELHDAVQPIWTGVKEEGQWKPRSIKIGEAKRAARSACAAAHRALNAYRKVA